ncbi:MAG: hypothetical protein UU82_C0011G0002 [Candidatus Nomurabacteria bacterium GW2011_GWC2_41_8]|uniref:Uncharacterized protein n=1 Tax=Candidatus Nomurabacteria bacterium GW2011_GWC2_41_8 TaxID=1618755 RepID=A0A0G0ZQ11_9BACT|nr:MAG: hypothetical protein UU82_C0011G0002 [Candidatus Nomurabacteria bacterium GW2011_GWC2_41_8]
MPDAHPQEEWLSTPEYRTVDGIKFDLPSSLEWGATIVALYHHRNTKDPAQQVLLEEFKLSLVDSLKKYVMTGTRTTYDPRGNDFVEHNGNAFCFVQGVALAGENRSLKASMDTESIAWLGVGAREFMDAVKYVTDSTAYLWRLEKPNATQEVCALVLGVDVKSWFYISANGSTNIPWHARGVKIMPRATGPGVRVRA